MHVCMHACMYVCMYACLYSCMCVCTYVCMYVYMYSRTYVCMYVYVRSMYSFMYVGMHVFMYVFMRVYLCRYVRMYSCMYIISPLRNIPTGCTFVFRMTVTTPPQSIAIALLGPTWLINVPENKKIISSNGLIPNYTKTFRNNEMQVQFLRAQKTHSNMINYTFCLAVRASRYYVSLYCGVLTNLWWQLARKTNLQGEESAILYNIHRELHRNRNRTFRAGPWPATVRTVNYTYPVTILQWKWTRTSGVRTRRPVVETTARLTTPI